MALYPIFLDLTGGRVLVAGAGSVGRRKIAGLLDTGVSEILVLDPGASGDLFSDEARVRLARRAAAADDVAGRVLAFAATSDKAENARVALLCKAAGVLCNVADDPPACAFHVPALAVAGDIRVAVSTAGLSPALARRIRLEIESSVLPRHAALATLMGRLRPLVLAGGETPENGELFRSLVASELADALAAHDANAARNALRGVLPVTLHGYIEGLLYGLC